MKKKLWSGLALVAGVGWLAWQNLTVGVSRYQLSSHRLPQAFDDYKIVQVSDFHSQAFYQDNASLLSQIKQEKPDMIVITGDLVDGRRKELDKSIRFVKELVQIAPTYFVTGNHEAGLGQLYAQEETQLQALGVKVLRSQALPLSRGTETINLMGVDDPNFTGQTAADMLDSILPDLMEKDQFNLLLSHRPEAFETYVKHGVDLVLTGHVHGGQVRLPFVGGLVGPHQGFFPKYDAGIFRAQQTQMVVSRGLGNSLIPVRVNNQPELVVITLTRSKA